MAKKRKQEMQPEEDSGLYHAFVGAANAVSHLFTQAQKEQRAAASAAARASLERTAAWLDGQAGAPEGAVPKWALRQFLNEEHLKAGGTGLYCRQQRAGIDSSQEGLTTPGPMAPSNQTPMWTDGLRTGAPEGSGVMFGYQSGLQAHGHSGDTRSFGYTQTGNSVGFPIGHNGQHGYMSGGCLSNHGPTSSLGGQP